MYQLPTPYMSGGQPSFRQFQTQQTGPIMQAQVPQIQQAPQQDNPLMGVLQAQGAKNLLGSIDGTIEENPQGGIFGKIGQHINPQSAHNMYGVGTDLGSQLDKLNGAATQQSFFPAWLSGMFA